MVKYQDGVYIRERSPIPVLTGPGVEQLRLIDQRQHVTIKPNRQLKEHTSDWFRPNFTRIYPRSASNEQLFIPRTRLTFGERMFSVSAPRARNSLPVDIRSTSYPTTFKKKLKTFLFHKAFQLPSPCSLDYVHYLFRAVCYCYYYYLFYFIFFAPASTKPQAKN